MKLAALRPLVFVPMLAVPLFTPSPMLAASVQAIALHKSDVPKGFHQTTAHALSLAEAAKSDGVSVAALRNHGRLAAYITEFTSGGKGLNRIQDEIDSYRRPSGARWDYTLSLKSLRAQIAARKLKLKSLGAPRIGDESIAYTIREKAPAQDITIALAAFRHGPYDGEVNTIGRTGAYNPQIVVRLLKIMEGRT